MALNNVWEDKQDGIDDILSKDINDIAHAVIEGEKGIEELKEGKAEKGELKNTDISQVGTSGIYDVDNDCTGLPGDLGQAWCGKTLIVSANTAGNYYNQYLIANWYADENGEMTEYTRIYACFIYNPSGTPSYDMPWTLIYDTSKPQLMLDATLSEDGAAADAKAVGYALSKKADSVTAEGKIVRQDTLFTAGGVSANLDEWVQTASAADNKAQDNAHEIEGLKEGKAEKGILENIDIRSVSESGIYSVGYGCTGYPNNVIENEWNLKMLIVSTDIESTYSECTQYLFLATTYPAVAQIYIGKFIQANGSITPNVFWTLVYDSSFPQLTLDNTLTKEGAAADSKAVGDALAEKAALSFVEKLIPVGEASGNPVTIKDPLEGMRVIDYKICGESVQDGVPSPESPAPIKSVGDLITEGGQSGKYKIPVTVIGKNIFNVNGGKTFSGCSGTVSDGVLSLLTGSGLGGQRCMYTVECTPNTAYTLSFKCDMTEVPLGNEVAVMVRETTSGGGTLGLKAVASADGEKVTSDTLTFTSGDRTQFVVWLMARRNTVTQAQSYSVKYWDIQVEENAEATEYQQYMSQEYVIYIDEPLRKVGDTADYIDYSGGQIVRNVEVVDDTGTKPIIESYTVLAEPVYTSISLPSVILPQSLMSSIEVQTSIKGDFSIKYYQDINKKLKELQSLIALNIPSTLPAETLEE